MRNLPSHNANPNLILALYFLFKSVPALVSGLAIYLGYRLFVLGVNGEASIVVETTSVEGQLLNAAPGLVFAFVGLAVLGIVVWKGVEVSLSGTVKGEGGEEVEQGFALNERVDPRNRV